MAKKGQMIDLTGQTFGMLTVISLEGLHPTVPRQYRWNCRCECGVTKTVPGVNLRIGKTKSCGCLVGKNSTHGESNSDEFRIWRGMLDRCYNPNATSYARYGARGIAVCDEWRRDVVAFIADVGRRPSKDHSLDRKDNRLGYSPSNCRWATPRDQANNTRRNIPVFINGEHYPSVAEASRALDIPYDNLRYSIKGKSHG